MANLSVRRLDDETLELLRVRAARHGVSMEEEVRRIIRESVSAPARLGDLALEFFGESYGATIELPERKPHEPIDLDA
ncbi:MULTISPECIES: FitA-like ribbon-helix-helix domain-containing protein [unclassified Wenzhouxiangella]|uniref:FitA-like ribbon-helix-helix domain-containing protein n=1 Tax=unclassified Wenzhouxiangella TaxID=2613841 RepID=UPI000E32A2EF|nr:MULTISPECIES: Arc family DNA-binding protein [unclassified Wenzhouxiangella]RFF27848.1 Arc family DNA-binding protein [Wenzhouxiangella sp. 15181]RFP70341.1 Arc family DNA-binding protein [Wenzhouxiangella sp. 15190]